MLILKPLNGSDYENVDGRSFYSNIAVWADVFGSSRYIKFINYRESIYYERTW